MDDREPISLSRLSHAGFCLRRAALLELEQVWRESADTAKGRAEHERVHTQRVERRGNSAKLYEFPVYSHSLGVAGKCDCIEAEAFPGGCRIPALDFPLRLYPVEYKHGKLRAERECEIRLCAPLCDRAVISMFNRDQFQPQDFITDFGAVYLSDRGRRKVIEQWRSRKREPIRHPFLKEKISVGMIPCAQSMLFARVLRGDLDRYPPFVWR